MPSPPAQHRILSDRVNTFGQYLLKRYGQRVHKLALNAGFTCPNRDGSKGHGGCTFCNNVSFSPNAQRPPQIDPQLEAGRRVLAKRTGARRFMAYFQTYTNTYDEIDVLRERYDSALHASRRDRSLDRHPPGLRAGGGAGSARRLSGARQGDLAGTGTAIRR